MFWFSLFWNAKLEEEDDIPGLLLLIDFEKAFDTVEWSFIGKTLQFYSFGPSLQKWIKAFYCDISSAFTNNGHVSEFSPVQCKDLVFFHKMWLTACSTCFDNMTFLVASMTYCFLKLAVMRIVSR
jgi:hypothetical protein